MKRTYALRLTTALGAAALVAAAAGAQEADVAKDIEQLKQGQQQIRRELAEIKRMLEAAPSGAAAPARSPIEGKVFDLGANPVRGESTAKLTLVEFSDYQ